MSFQSGLVSIQPSGQWDGADGNWSTFEVELGTPKQSVRLLPGTSATAATAIWAIIREGCSLVNTGLIDCAIKRGNLFSSNASTSYSRRKLENNGLYNIPLLIESQLGLTDDNAYYGFDSVNLPVVGQALTLDQELVAGIATDDFFLGVLGLSPWSTNLTDYNDPIPSVLNTLRNQSIINSTSWAYTAGKAYHNLLGSLTLGGYDAARSSQASLEVPFGKDISRDLVITLRSITYDSYGAAPLLTEPIYSFIDSLVTDIWLPEKVCDLFAIKFNLTWSEPLQVYYVTDTAHNTLLAQQPQFNFTLGATASGGSSINISIPYAAFDLQKTVPDIGPIGTNRYFPLRRAANDSQYVLGRAFLQEAYVAADYDRGMFTIRQALNSNATQLLTLAPTEVASPVASSTGSLPAGTIAGIVLAIVVVLVIVSVAMYLLVRRRRRSDQGEKAVEADSSEQSELPADSQHFATKYAEMDPHDHAIHELRVEDPELDGEYRHELAGEERQKTELPAGVQHAKHAMLPAGWHSGLLSGERTRLVELPGSAM